MIGPISKPSVQTLTKIFEYTLFSRSNLGTLPQDFADLNFLSAPAYRLTKSLLRFVMLGQEARTAMTIVLSRFPVVNFYCEYVILSASSNGDSVKVLVDVPEIYAIEMNHCARIGRVVHLDENELDYDPFIFTHFSNFEEIEYFHQGGVSEPGHPEEERNLAHSIEMITNCVKSQKLRRLKDPGQALAGAAEILNGYYLDELHCYPAAIEFLQEAECVLKVGVLYYDTYFWNPPNVFNKIDTEDIMINVRTRMEPPGPELHQALTVNRINIYIEYNLYFENLFAFCAKTFPNLHSVITKTSFKMNILGAYESENPISSLGEVGENLERCFAFVRNVEAHMIEAKNTYKQDADIKFQIKVWWPTYDVMPAEQPELAHAICSGMLARYNHEYSTSQTDSITDAAPPKRLENGIVRTRYVEGYHVVLESNY
uniref:F-box domain-containing protein n=1 Tax=Panagrellus redivivus TaxID=6233 RepID=A0A7E4V7X0_PANRE